MIIYKNEFIEKSYNNGFYNAFIYGKGFLKADTLTGIKKLITEHKRGL